MWGIHSQGDSKGVGGRGERTRKGKVEFRLQFSHLKLESVYMSASFKYKISS